jgi:hypothetical protein
MGGNVWLADPSCRIPGGTARIHDPFLSFSESVMARRASHPAAAVLLACLCLSACKAEGDLANYETRASAEFSEAQRRAEAGPEKPTRQQALAEYRKCVRKMSNPDSRPKGMSADPRRACAHWMEKAYPSARNVRKRDSIPWSTEPQWVDPSNMESRIPGGGRVPAGTP